MPQLTTTLSLDAPVEQVFALFSDIPHATRIPGVVSVEMLTQGAIGKGTRFVATRRVAGAESTGEFELTDWQPGCSYTIACESEGATHTTRFDFVTYGGGTRVRLEHRMDAHTLMARVMSKMTMGAVRKSIQRDLTALKAQLETRALGAT